MSIHFAFTSKSLLVLLPALVSLACIVGCGAGEDAPEKPPAEELSGHEKMRRALAVIAERSVDENPFVGNRQLREYNSMLADAQYLSLLTPDEKWDLYFGAGRLELRLGNEPKAIELLEKSLQISAVVKDPAKAAKRSHFELGIANMRYGETQNCCLKNSAESCILPIRGEGLHTKKEGSQKAIEHFMAVLQSPAAEDDQDERLDVDEAARWLLNIAHMTLDQYPDGVPEKYRVKESHFTSSVEFPRFVNVYPKLGLSTFNLCGGAIVDDFDGDDDLDVVTCTWDVTGQTQVFRNLGNGAFEECTKEAGLEGFFGGLNLNQADYDNDGDLDVYINRGAWLQENGLHPNSLLRNDGGLKFTDVTIEAGLANDFRPTKTSAWADYDNDGDLDLFVGNDTAGKVIAPCQLFRNNGDGTFTDVARRAGVAAEVHSMGAVWGDYDGDRYPDLYLSRAGANILYHNNRDGTFTDVAEELGVTRPYASFPTWFWDFDNDGHLDIYVGCTSGPVGVIDTDIRFELMHLYRNQGDGTFRNVAPEMELTYPATPMGANFGDLNSDGFPDFYLATGNTAYSELRPNVMFCSDRGRRFDNVTMAGGFGHLQKGHGVSFADIDNDGDQDVYVQLGGAYPGDRFNDALFENPGFGNRWIMLHLEGRQSNRCAIGARIRLDVTENGAQRSIYHTVGGGSSFGANPLQQTIGLGKATKIDLLEIYWPTSDTTQTFENVEPDRALRIVEGENKLHVIPRRSFKLGSPRPQMFKTAERAE